MYNLASIWGVKVLWLILTLFFSQFRILLLFDLEPCGFVLSFPSFHFWSFFLSFALQLVLYLNSIEPLRHFFCLLARQSRKHRRISFFFLKLRRISWGGRQIKKWREILALWYFVLLLKKLWGDAKTLTKTVTKSNCLRKCQMINGPVVLFIEVPKMTVSQNWLTEAVILFTEAVRKCPPHETDLRRR